MSSLIDSQDPDAARPASQSLTEVFPTWAPSRFARWLKLNTRTVQRMFGEHHVIGERPPIPERCIVQIEEMRSRVAQSGIGSRIDGLIAELQAQGIDDDVISAWLVHRADGLVGQEPNSH